jgi:transposase-like protein
VESPLLSNGHGGFGRRPGETGWSKDQNRAPGRPYAHWIHLRTTNPIESTFATVRLRTRVTRGAGSRTAALAMTFKLIESAQMRWRAVNAPHLVALVRAGARFERGVLLEREAVA